jgi:hypothetical protein
MNNDANDVKSLIEQLKALHIQQTALLARLDTARARETAVAQEFAIGDRVRIKNPGLYQASTGEVIKLGKTRVTVQLPNGNKVQRARKNLTPINE